MKDIIDLNNDPIAVRNDDSRMASSSIDCDTHTLDNISTVEYRADKNFYPGYVRKAMTFTLDDGNLTYDKIFFSYTEPAGFKGVVNLVSSAITAANKAQYIEMYSDYEIGNHGKYHAFRLLESEKSRISNAAFNEATADQSKLYRNSQNSKLYHMYVPGVSGWRMGMLVEDFKQAVIDGTNELEDIFDREIGYYAFPNGYRDTDTGLPEYIEALGYYAVRKTGTLGSLTGFSLPADYKYITYNATVDDLLYNAKAYNDLADNGALKYFCFGLHAYDYNGKWDILKEFCDLYGNRPDTFWYATDREIFDYVNAVKALKLEKDRVVNDSDVTVYIKVDGEKKTVPARSFLTVDKR